MTGQERSASVSLKITSIFIILCCIIIAAIGFNIYNVKALKNFQNRDFRLIELAGMINHYDEVLTMSARIAAQSNDLKWKTRYDETVSKLDNAINESLSLMPEEYLTDGTKETNAANKILVELETRAFSLLETGEQEKAVSLLFSDEYEKQKKIYTNGTAKSVESMKTAVSSLIERQWKLTIWISIALSLGLVLAVFLRFYIMRRRTSSLREIARNLSKSAELVASASSQLSDNNQILVQGAAEQAAAIEETSSSIEEVSSMTRQNADNARQAETLMKEASKTFKKARQLTGELTRSMERISNASQETSKIIKSIDEVAFQTNLLALNAAVEAARAGEAGAGFAVVAGEVRNLAMRSADAARNTSSLIEDTVKEVRGGAEIVSLVNETFINFGRDTLKINDLVSEISLASDDQSRGIEQISKAISEIDNVTRQTADHARESASASKDMSAQAKHLKELVDDFTVIIGGAKSGNNKQKSRYSSKKPKSDDFTFKNVSGQSQISEKKAATTKKSSRDINLYDDIDPEQLIPLDEDDFKDF